MKKYSNSYYSATMNLYLHICDKLSHLFTELLSRPITIILSSNLKTIFNTYITTLTIHEV